MISLWSTKVHNTFQVFFSLSLFVINGGEKHQINFDIKMPGVSPTKHDQYFCTAKAIDINEAFIVGFEPHANISRAHHMILFGTEDIKPSKSYPDFWDCGHGGLPTGISIMFAWAKNAPPVTLPKDVGFRIGQNTNIKYVLLQVHYANPLHAEETDSSGLTLQITYQKQRYLAGIYILADSHSYLQPFKPRTHLDVNCQFNRAQDIHLFAYRVHAHKLGLVITGYKYNTRNESWTLLAKGNPQWPQAFYPMDSVHTVTGDDILTARCTYNTTSRTKAIKMGFSSNDEMCNLYLMYYVEASESLGFKESSCLFNTFPHLVELLPEGSDTPLPRNSSLEEIAVEKSQVIPAEDLKMVPPNVEEITLSKKGDGRHRPSLEQEPEIESQETSQDGGESVQLLGPGPQLDDSYKYNEISSWPNTDYAFGQISAVTFDNSGNVVIFHRGTHVWNTDTFDYGDNYLKVDEGPISNLTVISLDPKTGALGHCWGSNLFYMPHGLSIDKQGNAWLTDVAMHQVFKFPEKGAKKALLTLGEQFIPGNDKSHFCKPASVTSDSDGDIYVADGYCNSRIVRFSSLGVYKSHFGQSNFPVRNPAPVNTFYIPHKVILMENEELICVADRENGRVQCFERDSGKFHLQILREEFHGRLFSIAGTQEKGGLLYAVCGPSLGDTQKHPVQAFVFNLTRQSLLNIVTPKQGTFSQPHDIAISPNAEDLYVVEIGPNKVWKFQHETNKAGEHLPEVAVTTKPVTESTQTPLPKKLNKPAASSAVVSEASNFATSMVIMALLGIPILLLVLITVIVRLKKRGKFQQCSLPHVKGWLGGYRTPRSAHEKFNIGSLLNPHKGFDRVALDESDVEGDEKSDSDIEEFNAASRKA